MPSVEELLSKASEDEYIDISPINDIITIDPETRTINLPASETLFGTEQEMDVERKYFKCPKIVGDNIDLSKHQIYITYVTAKDNTGIFLPDEEFGLYYCEDMAVDGDYITFSWLLSGNVLKSHGFIAFAVSAKHMDGEVLKTRWKTKPAVGTVLLTVPDGDSQIVEAYPDIIGHLLNRMDEVEAIATPEAMQNYVEAYLTENPPSGMTDEEREQLQKNTEDISSLSEEMEQLKQSGTGTGSGTGWTPTQINLLENIGQYLLFSDAKTGQLLFDSLITSLRNSASGGGGSEEPENPDATLTGITAEYTGGDVVVGTSVTELKGITVTATYSDGSVINVTGYALFGEIVEGENTITVSYGGLETTFTVTGVTEPSGEVTPTTYTVTNSLTNVSTDNSAETIDRGASYTATLTPSSNYYIDTVIVTMGGINVTDTVYADGVITIPEVTGNVVIVANGTESDNLITAELLAECGSGSLPDGSSFDGTTMLLTPFIAVEPSTTYFSNIARVLPDGSAIYNQKITRYDAGKNVIRTVQIGSAESSGLSKHEMNESTYYVRIGFSVQWTNPYFGKSGVVV